MDRALIATPASFTGGCSIILCCHNSASRLPETLKALSLLRLPAAQPVEVLLIDNASTDHTSSVAQDIWLGLSTHITLRVVPEPNPGLMHARRTGIREAQYALLVFCDDDNLLSEDYLLIAYQHFSTRPSLGALGGFGIPVFEGEPPGWFGIFHSAYATGSQAITAESGRSLNLYGAGLVVRKTALERLYSGGYRPLLTGRTGRQVIGAEDTEMTYALVIAGYTLDYDDNMQFRHMLPPARLTKAYREKLLLSSAIDGPVRNLYHAYATKRTIPSLMKHWPVHLLIALLRIPKYYLKPPKAGFRKHYLQWNLQYIRSLIAFRPEYQRAKDNITRIPRHIQCPSGNERLLPVQVNALA